MELWRWKKGGPERHTGSQSCEGYDQCPGRWRCPLPSLPWCTPPTICPLKTDNKSSWKKKTTKTFITHFELQSKTTSTALRVRSEEREIRTEAARAFQLTLSGEARPAALITRIFRRVFFPVWLWSQTQPSRSFSSPLQLGLSVYTAVAFPITFPVYVLSGKGCRHSLSLYTCQCMEPAAIKCCLPSTNLGEAKRALVSPPQVPFPRSSPYTTMQKSCNCSWTRTQIFLLTPPQKTLSPASCWVNLISPPCFMNQHRLEMFSTTEAIWHLWEHWFKLLALVLLYAPGTETAVDSWWQLLISPSRGACRTAAPLLF